MTLQALPFNVVDAGIALVLFAFALRGLRRGLLRGISDLAGVFAAFLFAITFYAQSADWLAQKIALPPILLNVVAMVGLFFVGQFLFGLVVSPVLSLIYRLLLPGPLRWLDSLAGTIPGLFKGTTVVAILVTVLALFPWNPDLAESIRSSALGAQLVDQVAIALPRLEGLVGNPASRNALFFTRPVGSETPKLLSLPAGVALDVDSPAEQRMTELLNAERAKAGLPPLALDDKLIAVARAHSEDMFRRAYFAHESLDGDKPGDRLRLAGISFSASGENLAYAPTVDVAHAGLMNSPGHRSNILSPGFARVGIGVIDGGLYGKMISQEFAN